MKLLLAFVSFANKVVNGNCAFSTPSFHRLNIVGGGCFVISEQQD